MSSGESLNLDHGFRKTGEDGNYTGGSDNFLHQRQISACKVSEGLE